MKPVDPADPEVRGGAAEPGDAVEPEEVSEPGVSDGAVEPGDTVEPEEVSDPAEPGVRDGAAEPGEVSDAVEPGEVSDLVEPGVHGGAAEPGVLARGFVQSAPCKDPLASIVSPERRSGIKTTRLMVGISFPTYLKISFFATTILIFHPKHAVKMHQTMF